MQALFHPLRYTKIPRRRLSYLPIIFQFHMKFIQFVPDDPQSYNAKMLDFKESVRGLLHKFSYRFDAKFAYQTLPYTCIKAKISDLHIHDLLRVGSWR